MNTQNKKQSALTVKKIKNPLKPWHTHIGLLLVVVLTLLITGTYVAFAIKNSHASRETATFEQSGKPANKASSSDKTTHLEESTTANAGTDSSSNQKTATSSTAATLPKFSFVDTSHWITKDSRDGSFSIMYLNNLVYATCPDLADNLMIAMVGPMGSDLACGSLQEAVSIQPYNGHANTVVIRTETMIAQTDDVWDRSGASAMTVTLADGQVAQRYEYASVILGRNYHTIEYDTVFGGKRYVAVDNWQTTKSPNISVDDFDTMIQKTWMFN